MQPEPPHKGGSGSRLQLSALSSSQQQNRLRLHPKSGGSGSATLNLTPFASYLSYFHLCGSNLDPEPQHWFEAKFLRLFYDATVLWIRIRIGSVFRSFRNYTCKYMIKMIKWRLKIFYCGFFSLLALKVGPHSLVRDHYKQTGHRGRKSERKQYQKEKHSYIAITALIT